MLALVEGSKNLRRLCREYETESVTVHLKELVGGAFSLYAAATIRRTGGVHVFVAEDRDAAAYLLNDLYALLDERRILFFPSSYKRSIVYGAEDAQGVVQRTAALNALRTPPAGYLALCTYPEALAERVVDAEALRRETMTVRAGDRLRPADLVEWLDESGFVRVDFVYEPGQYSQRGGIVDVFSYVESLPYRFDFFDEEVDSIRRFNISSQLSQDKLQQAEIIPIPCSGLMEFVEQGILRGEQLSAYLFEKLSPYLKVPVDAVVLGCTHYSFLQGAIRRIVGRTPEIIDGSYGIAMQLRRRLEAVDELNGSGARGTVTFENSLDEPEILALSRALLDYEEEE